MTTEQSPTGLRRRSRLFALAPVVAMAVAGCGGSSDGGGGGGTPAEVTKQISAVKVGPESSTRGDITQMCGDKKIKVALADGFGSNTWRKTARAEFEDEAAKCPNITDVLYADGQGNPQKAISDIKSLAAQNVDVLVIFPDAGPALLPAIRAAYKSGVQVVPYFGAPLLALGKPGVDFTDIVGPASDFDNGKLWAQWLVDRLKGKGDVAYLGGPAGNPVSSEAVKGVREVFKANPGMKLIEDKYFVTNWDPAEQQKVTSGLLAKYPKIDGVIGDFSDGAFASIRAFQAANRPLVPFSTQDNNGVGCSYKKLKGSNPKFEVATRASGEWMVRVALRKGVAAAQGQANDEVSLFNMELIEDSADPAKQPKCDPDLPPSAILSANLTKEQQSKLFGG